MPTYLVEVYAPRGADVAELVSQARAAADGLEHVRSMFVPEDEICFHVFSAAAPASVSNPSPSLGRLVEVIEEPRTRAVFSDEREREEG
jgi:hypothetical protein